MYHTDPTMMIVKSVIIAADSVIFIDVNAIIFRLKVKNDRNGLYQRISIRLSCPFVGGTGDGSLLQDVVRSDRLAFLPFRHRNNLWHICRLMV